MAKCKFCGQGVRSGLVFHTGCWEQRANSCVAWLTVIPVSIITRAVWMAIRVLHVRPASVGNGTEASHD